MEIASMLVRRALGRCAPDGPTCAGCRRTPLPGELLYRLEDGGAECGLCRSHRPEAQRAPARAERVRADHRPLVVEPLQPASRAA